MFKKVLVANRGEIAVQIIRTLREMGIQSVAVYAVSDRDELFVDLADEAVCIGDGSAIHSYLNMEAVISAAVLTGCEAIHPGYGFLSERAEFAKLCADCGLVFIGPDAKTIHRLGNKYEAKKTVQSFHLPVIPGSDDLVHSVEEAKKIALEIGYPVMLKAVDGGGGKGIRAVNNEAEMERMFPQAQQESLTAYGNDHIYMEKVLTDAKHIEMQILADQYGNAIYLPERDCSLQRHKQKMVEITPCVLIDEKLRQQIGRQVVEICQQIHYVGTGTFEFLLKDGQLYFMEMNTRLQVEYTVTEEISGIELIRQQILIAAGCPLEVKQSDVGMDGYAMECRINAEDPYHQFIPSAGHFKLSTLPCGSKGVRIDTALKSEGVISPMYDAMIAKIVVHLPTFAEVVAKMCRILTEWHCEGIQTNEQFLIDLLQQKAIQEGQFTTMYLEEQFLESWVKQDAS